MRKLYLFFVLLGVAISTNAQSTNGLIAHWKFNGNTNDATGNGHNGTTISNITYTQGVTSSDTAALFNGTNSYITVPYQSDLNLTNFSICTKVKLNGFYTGLCQANRILQRGTEFASGYYLLHLFDNQTDSSCAVTGDTSNFVFSHAIYSRGAYLKHWRDTPTVRTNRWYCVVTTWDSTVYNVYVDGVLVNTVNPIILGNSYGSSTDGISIGANRFGNYTLYPYWLNGAIDDLRLYNRALTPTEIASYCNSSPTPDTNVVLTGLSDTLFCGESTVTASYTTNYSFASNNIFTLQLSDATGSFASPTILGNTSSSTSGTVTGFVPGTLTPGNYKLRVVGSNPIKISNEKNITVAQAVSLAASVSASPSVNVGPFTPITFTATVPSGITTATYQWKRNGINIPGATSNTYTTTTVVNLNDGDKIHVSVASTQACVNPTMVNSDTLTIGVSLSVNDLKQHSAIRVSPNPNNGSFKLSGIVKTESVQVQIVNAIGQTVYRKEVATPNGKLQENIQLTDIASGLYQIRLQAGKETLHIPVQIQ